MAQANLPKPLTTWRQKTSGLMYSVASSEPGEVVAINTVDTWAGSPEDFAKQFEEVRPT